MTWHTKAAKVGRTALRIYACHLIAFTAGVVAGSIQTFGILAAMWL